MTAFELPAPVQFSRLEWRPARLEDSAAIHRLVVEIERVDQRGWIDTLEDRRRDFEDPYTTPATDTLLALTPDGRVAALGWVFAPPAGESEYIAHLWGEVHPDFRSQGLGSFILSWTEARGRQILAERPEHLPHYLRTGLQVTHTHRIALLEKHGFQPVRYGFKMRRALSLPVPDSSLPEGIEIVHWQPERNLEVLDVSHQAFRDHWGAIPLNEEVWDLYMTGHPNFRPDLTFLALAQGEGPANKKVVGFSINQVNTAEMEQTGIKEGWIQELGVLRPWRKQGIATALLCASLHAFQEAGLEYAGLGVDAQNLTGALRIYERLGFQVLRRFVTYSKTA